MIQFKYLIGTRTRNLPCCSLVPQSLRHRVPRMVGAHGSGMATQTGQGVGNRKHYVLGYSTWVLGVGAIGLSPARKDCYETVEEARMHTGLWHQGVQ
jgi:hypothetical protein